VLSNEHPYREPRPQADVGSHLGSTRRLNVP
jgi:hypothetical protein